MPYCEIHVTDIGDHVISGAARDDRSNRAPARGGAALLPRQTLPGIGRFANVEDGDGNIVGMLQNTPEAS